MRTIELLAFRYRDPLTGRLVRSRYKAERHVIEQRHPGAEVLEATKEVRDVSADPRPHPSKAG